MKIPEKIIKWEDAGGSLADQKSCSRNETHHDDGGVSTDESRPHQSKNDHVGEERGHVARIGQVVDQGHGAHGPVTAQGRGERQEPAVEGGQIIVRQLAAGEGGG